MKKKELETEYYKAKEKAVKYLRPINKEAFDMAFGMCGKDLKLTLVYLESFKKSGNFNFDSDNDVIQDFLQKWQVRNDYQELENKH